MINTEKTEIVQKQVSEWLNNKYFSHYLVVDLPFNRKHYGFEQATEYLKIIVKRFEKELVGRHWNKKPVHFIAFVEKGKFHIYHWNLLLWAFQYTDQELQTAVDKTLKYMNLDDSVMEIQPIEYTRSRLNDYNVKELESDNKFHINSDCIFTSETLFYL